MQGHDAWYNIPEDRKEWAGSKGSWSWSNQINQRNRILNFVKQINRNNFKSSSKWCSPRKTNMYGIGKHTWHDIHDIHKQAHKYVSDDFETTMALAGCPWFLAISFASFIWQINQLSNVSPPHPHASEYCFMDNLLFGIGPSCTVRITCKFKHILFTGSKLTQVINFLVLRMKMQSVTTIIRLRNVVHQVSHFYSMLALPVAQLFHVFYYWSTLPVRRSNLCEKCCEAWLLVIDLAHYEYTMKPNTTTMYFLRQRLPCCLEYASNIYLCWWLNWLLRLVYLKQWHDKRLILLKQLHRYLK